MRSSAMGRPDTGASAVEYALLLAFVALVVLAAVTLLGDSLPDLLDVEWPS